MKNADFYIDYLHLKPHPEGGYYAETYRSAGTIPAHALTEFDKERNFSTAIFYLLRQGDHSVFHRIKSDECWHFYAGDTLLIHVLYSTGNYACIKLGAVLEKGERLQFIVPANTWFAAECGEHSAFTLTGCTVAPGFDFADFETGNKEQLLNGFPLYEKLISRLSR